MRTVLFVVATVLLIDSSIPPPAVGATAAPTPAPGAFSIQSACSVSPCGGACAVCPPCTPGAPCPEVACVLGQCQMLADTCTCVPGIPAPTPTAAECDQNCEPGSRCGQFPCGLETVEGVCETSGSTCVCVPPPCVFLTPTPTPASPTPPPPCSAAPCGGSCTIPAACPLGVACPIQLGQCEKSTSSDCECVPVVPTPLATPTPQCSTAPCDGDCTISFPCIGGPPCPEAPVRLGQCESTSSGCECVAISPTPMPTPTPQCTDACSGPCTISFPPLPCPRPGVCSGAEVPVLPGQCEMTTSFECACVPVSPTPTATPTPQCTGACSGPCTIAFACPPNVACPDLVQLGQCESSGTSDCACVPLGSTPAATPTPECSGDSCSGSCVVSPPPFPCPPGKLCNGPDVPVLPGQCEPSTSGDGCECVPATPPPSPTPIATPTPQCDAAACGGQCVISPPCLSWGCEVPDLLGSCEVVSGSCTCVAAAEQATLDHSPHRYRHLPRSVPDHTVR